ncbi:MAG: type pilus assembly PilZ [Verrucomicrobiaceae bacterium]|nr:type pilus assembly PilZ [Verrucomicrobiaceae bacterium]
MRKFVRHPSSIPIELSVARAAIPRARCRNISNGGFACTVDEPLPVGSSVCLRIPVIWPEYRGNGVVAWCQQVTPAYEIGIQFVAQDLFKTKMVEQLCQIEQYRIQLQLNEGRTLSSQAAAEEWIALYAKDFSDSFLGSDESAGN